MNGTNRWTRWLIAPALTLMLVLSACDESPTRSSEQGSTLITGHQIGQIVDGGTVDLFAGQDIDVGDVTVTDDGTDLTVHITTTAKWCVTELHLDAADTKDGIPQNRKGNPVPGQFQLNETLACETDFSRNLAIPTPNDGDVVVAVHTVVADAVQYAAAGGLEGTELIFGVGQSDNKLYRLDLDALTATEVFQTGFTGTYLNSPNGLAYDGMNQRVYYTIDPTGAEGDPSELWFYSFATDTEQNAWVGNKLAGFNVSGAWYGGKYYYVPNGTADLRAVSFNGDGTVASDALVIGDFNGAAADVYRFGDIAIHEGLLYASTNSSSGSTAELFTIDLDTDTYTNLYPSQTWTGDPSGLQLAFDEEGTLYAHTAGAGTFFTIDDNTNTVTALGTISGLKFTDLANGPTDVDTETAWADGDRFVNRGNWATFIDYDLGVVD